jgi:HK97 family phage major capsid protein
MAKYLTPALQELRSVLVEADEISNRADGSKRDDSRLNFLLAKIKALQANPMLPQGADSVEFFRALFSGKEVRTVLQEGTQSITATQGNEGGYLVPQEFNDNVVKGMAQFDPLLNEDVVSLIESPSFELRPFDIPGWDLSTFTAVKVAEGAQQNAQTPPTITNKLLNAYKYKASLALTTELEDDAFMPTMKLMSDAFSIGFGRGIGVDLAIGNGTTAPQGVLTGAGASVFTCAAANSVKSTDVSAVYFAVNRFNRAAPKCAWLMSDGAYQLVRNATDNQNRPLLTFENDRELLMGKPVLISPSLPNYNASLGTQAAGSFCVFGDLSHLYVRISKMVVKRQWQLPGYVEKGQALYTGIMRADAKLVDPTGGVTPPIVCASLHS